MRKKRLVARCMLAVMVASNVLGNVVPIAANQSNRKEIATEFNGEGIWLTEIYQNDVDRSTKNNKRESSGYESIKLYKSTTDLMEFIEITSTYKEDINFNDMFELVYRADGASDEIILNVSDMNGNTNVLISPNTNIVIWNCREDVTTGIPSEAEFREAMRVPDNAVVLKTTSGINWATSAYFSIRRKSDGKDVSSFTAKDKVHTVDGFSVELKIPDIGNDMEVYRVLNVPSAGYVYSGQLNGLRVANVPDAEIAKGVYITEVRPNDVNRSTLYGISDDFMECVEIVNTTDEAIDLNDEYQVVYFVKEGSRKVLQIRHYDGEAVNHEGSMEGCTIQAGGTAVLWCYREKSLSNYTAFPTEEEFRKAYGVPDEVPVYIFSNQNGLNNTSRAFEIYKKDTKELISSYCYVGNDDCKDNKSAELSVNPEGPEMILSGANVATSMGTVNPEQYTYLKDDGSALKLELNDVIPSSVKQGEDIRVNFFFDVIGNLPRTGITTYYRFDGEGAWKSKTEKNRRVPNLYEALISSDELFSHNYVEFYVSADNRYRSTLSEIYRVNIDKLNIKDDIRTNIKEGEEVKGSISITANDGSDNSSSDIYIDGLKCSTKPMLENGAFFTFCGEGRDSYFRNAITTVDNEIISSVAKWQYNILDGRAVYIDNKYFTYNEVTDSYDTTLRFWAGTYGTTVDEYLLPDANRENFTVKELALKLINGNTYYPVAIGPDNTETSEKTNLSTDYNAVHSIGDSTGMCPYMDVSFTIPASEVTAVGTEFDTRTLSDGEHTIKVTNGTYTHEVKFIVDNSAPEIKVGIREGEVLKGNIVINPQVTEKNSLAEVTVLLDGKEINGNYETTGNRLGDGEHTLTVFAKDQAGNESSENVTFTVEDATIVVTDGGVTNISSDSAELYLKLMNSSETEATFYMAHKISASDITTNTKEGILPYIQYEINVGDVKNNDLILVNWDGTASNSDKTHANTIFVKNVNTDQWDKVLSVDETGIIKNATFTAENHVKNGIATIIVQCSADSALPDLDSAKNKTDNSNANWDGTNVPEKYDFCFAWETDTQYYAEEWQHHFINMNNWIVNNKDTMNIKYVIHTGDIVDDVDMIYQWENADEAMKIFDDAKMAYGVLGGNHDTAAGIAEYDNYYTYFGEERFENQPTYGGSYKNNRGHYDLISENGQDFVIVYMSWNIYQEEIDWMNAVLEKYSDRKAILCFHTYTNVKTSTDTYLDYYGELIKKYVVAKNPNVFAVLNGHYHGSSYETEMFDDNGDGVKDRTVYQICTDYQSGFEGGSEYIKFLYFDIENDKVYMNSYSPCFDDFNFYDTELHMLNVEGAKATGVDKMVLDVDFKSEEQSILENKFTAYVCKNEEIGKATVDKVNGEASVTISGLSENTEYAWYAVVTNKYTGHTRTGLYEFKTEKKSVKEEEPVAEETQVSDDIPVTEETQVSDNIPVTEEKQVEVSVPMSGTQSTISGVNTGDSTMFIIIPLLAIAVLGAGTVMLVLKKGKLNE